MALRIQPIPSLLMSFLLVPHMPRFVVMVAIFIFFDGKVNNLIYCYFLLATMVNNTESDPLRPDDCKLCY